MGIERTRIYVARVDQPRLGEVFRVNFGLESNGLPGVESSCWLRRTSRQFIRDVPRIFFGGHGKGLSPRGSKFLGNLKLYSRPHQPRAAPLLAMTQSSVRHDLKNSDDDRQWDHSNHQH